MARRVCAARGLAQGTSKRIMIWLGRCDRERKSFDDHVLKDIYHCAGMKSTYVPMKRDRMFAMGRVSAQRD